MSFNNVFKIITTVTVDREKTAIYTTKKEMYMFNTEVLPVDIGERIAEYIYDNDDVAINEQRVVTIKDNVTETRVEFQVQGTLEDLKGIIKK